jgi:hypothetical protein
MRTTPALAGLLAALALRGRRGGERPVTNLHWVLLAALLAWVVGFSLLPGTPATTTRPTAVHVAGLPRLF